MMLSQIPEYLFGRNAWAGVVICLLDFPAPDIVDGFLLAIECAKASTYDFARRAV
jgi:hypothetical protein